jgi:hypothetical protein
MMKTVDDRVGQIERLKTLVQKAARSDGSSNYGAMLMIDQPGDIVFLAPVFPEFRGIEIVSAAARPDGKNYDLWDKSGKILQADMTIEEVIAWLTTHAKSDAAVGDHIVEWTEDTLAFYRVPKRVGA